MSFSKSLLRTAFSHSKSPLRANFPQQYAFIQNTVRGFSQDASSHQEDYSFMPQDSDSQQHGGRRPRRSNRFQDGNQSQGGGRRFNDSRSFSEDFQQPAVVHLRKLMGRLRNNEQIVQLFDMFCSSRVQQIEPRQYIPPNKMVLAEYIKARMTMFDDALETNPSEQSSDVFEDAHVKKFKEILSELTESHDYELTPEAVEYILTPAKFRNWDNLTEYFWRVYFESGAMIPSSKSFVRLIHYAVDVKEDYEMVEKIMELYREHHRSFPVKQLLNYYMKALLKQDKYEEAIDFVKHNIARVDGIHYQQPFPRAYSSFVTYKFLLEYLESLQNRTPEQEQLVHELKAGIVKFDGKLDAALSKSKH